MDALTNKMRRWHCLIQVCETKIVVVFLVLIYFAWLSFASLGLLVETILDWIGVVTTHLKHVEFYSLNCILGAYVIMK